MTRESMIPRPLVVLSLTLLSWALVIFAVYGAVAFYVNLSAGGDKTAHNQEVFLPMNQLPGANNGSLEHLLAVAGSLTVNTVWFQDLNRNGVYEEEEDYLYDLVSADSKTNSIVKYSNKSKRICEPSLVFAAELQTADWFVTKPFREETPVPAEPAAEKSDQIVDVVALM